MESAEPPYIGPWEMTPRWHWRRLFGLDLRRWAVWDDSHISFHVGGGRWEYSCSKKVAREMLHSAYGGESSDAPSAMTFD